jgi:hypothetical protein
LILPVNSTLFTSRSVKCRQNKHEAGQQFANYSTLATKSELGANRGAPQPAWDGGSDQPMAQLTGFQNWNAFPLHIFVS